MNRALPATIHSFARILAFAVFAQFGIIYSVSAEPNPGLEYVWGCRIPITRFENPILINFMVPPRSPGVCQAECRRIGTCSAFTFDMRSYFDPRKIVGACQLFTHVKDYDQTFREGGYVTCIEPCKTEGVCGQRRLFHKRLFAGDSALPETNNAFAFSIADWNLDGKPDLVAVQKTGTTSNFVEVSILSGATNFQTYLLKQADTILPSRGTNFEFEMADWDQDRKADLIAIEKSGTASQSTEVHVLTGRSKFQDQVLHEVTSLHETHDNFQFSIADWDADQIPDLVALKKSQTGSSSTEVHILSGDSKFKKYIVQIGTALHETGTNVELEMADWDQDGLPDLFAVKKSQTGSDTTEVHILSDASNFQRFVVQTGSILDETADGTSFAFADWDGDGSPELFAIKQSGSFNNLVDITILN